MLNMFKLNSLLVSSAGKLCRQLTASLNAHGSFLCESSGVHRSLCTVAASPQKTTESDIDAEQKSKDFSLLPPMPGQDSPLRWGGKKFEELPIAHIKATYNNTHIQMTDSAGQSLVRTSCGTEGFKNRRKSTPIAAQTAAISAAAKCTAKGVTYVRVMVKGLGPGRLSAVKGLTMGGLEVVSITDNTPVPHNGCRPRKARRI